MTLSVLKSPLSCSLTQSPPPRNEELRANTDKKCSWIGLQSKALAWLGMQEVYPMGKMRKNACKAVSEHQFRDSSALIATNKEIKSYVAKHQTLSTLVCKSEVYEQQGTRYAQMEDMGFESESAQGILTAVFDGHGGASVAKHCVSEFAAPFFASIAGQSRNIREAFHSRFDELNKEALNREDFNEAGATAVVTYLDHESNQIFTATLGDSEAFIFRNLGEGLKVIPLSCVRDWVSGKDSNRLLDIKPNASINFNDPKCNRFPLRNYGLNVSRTIGDKVFRDAFESMKTEERKGFPNPLSSKPKVAAARVYPEDIVVIGSDGLTDAVKLSEMVEAVQSFNPAKGKTLATTLGELASSANDDDVTVRVIFIGAGKSA